MLQRALHTRWHSSWLKPLPESWANIYRIKWTRQISKFQVRLLKKNERIRKLKWTYFQQWTKAVKLKFQSLCSYQVRCSNDQVCWCILQVTQTTHPSTMTCVFPCWDQAHAALCSWSVLSPFSFPQSSLSRSVQCIFTQPPKKSLTSWESYAEHCWQFFLQSLQASPLGFPSLETDFPWSQLSSLAHLMQFCLLRHQPECTMVGCREDSRYDLDEHRMYRE